MTLATGTAAGLAWPGWPVGAQQPPAGSESTVPPETRERLQAYFDDLCAWIMSLDVGSNHLKGTKDTATSIFINGNFARVLLASYRITGTRAHLNEAVRWCDTFCSIQQRTESSKGDEVGYWPDCGPQGNIYFGDAGTAAHALAAISREAGQDRQGSWEPDGRWCCKGGRVYATAVNALTLEVYYRYASVFGGKN